MNIFQRVVNFLIRRKESKTEAIPKRLIAAYLPANPTMLTLTMTVKRRPNFQNYWYESTLPHVKTLGKLYQQLAQKMQHSQSEQDYVREAVQ